MKTFLFRTDASFEIGSGHIIRCRNLARELASLGGEIFFITKDLKGNLINLLKDEFKTYKISCKDKFIGKYKSDNINNYIYEKNIESSQEDDALQTLKLIEKKIEKRNNWII